MQEVQIKIRDIDFNNGLLFVFKDPFSISQDMYMQIHELIVSKFSIRRGGDIGYLKDGETYESILDALWEFQLSLIPDYKPDKEFMPRYTAPRISDRYGGDKISDYFVPKDFYNHETRIITITKFE